MEAAWWTEDTGFVTMHLEFAAAAAAELRIELAKKRISLQEKSEDGACGIRGVRGKYGARDKWVAIAMSA